MYNFEEIKNVLERYEVEMVYSCFGSDPCYKYDTVYTKDGVVILHESNYNFLEVVGLSKEHFNEICNICIIDHKAEYQRNLEELAEYEALCCSEPICRTIDIMVDYFAGNIDDNALVEAFKSMSYNNKYVIDHIISVITDTK